MEVVNEIHDGLYTFDELNTGDVVLDSEGELYIKTDEEEWPLVSLPSGTLYHATDISYNREYRRVVACVKLTGYMS